MVDEDQFKTVYVTIQPSDLKKGESAALTFSKTRTKGEDDNDEDAELKFDEVPWLEMSSGMLDFSASMGDLGKNMDKPMFGSEDRTQSQTGVKKSSSVRLSKKKSPKDKQKIEFFRLLNAVKSENDWDEETVLEMLEEIPSLAKKKFLFAAFKEPVMALHYLCAFNAPLDCVKKCFKQNPSALHDASPSIGTPLHFACFYKASSRIVRYLASRDQPALKLVNRGKRTPLHTAVIERANAELVVLLTEACPDAAAMTDKDGMTPLDLAVSIPNPDLVVVEDLTEVNPAAISSALHRAISNETVGIEILKDMILSNPKALNSPDKDENLPLHAMVQAKRCSKEIKICVRKYPKATHGTNGDGMTPFDLAKSMELDDDIIDLLKPQDEHLFD